MHGITFFAIDGFHSDGVSVRGGQILVDGGCGWENADNKKTKRKKAINAEGKKNKQTNKGKKFFFQVAVDPSLTYRT